MSTATETALRAHQSLVCIVFWPAIMRVSKARRLLLRRRAPGAGPCEDTAAAGAS